MGLRLLLRGILFLLRLFLWGKIFEIIFIADIIIKVIVIFLLGPFLATIGEVRYTEILHNHSELIKNDGIV